MPYNLITIICIAYSLFLLGSCDNNNHDNQFCHKYGADGSCESLGDDDGPCWIMEENDPRVVKGSKYGQLYRIEPYELGHEQEVEIDEKIYKLITRAKKPLLFEIPNFVSDDEIKTILDRAEKTGMFSSKAKGGLTPQDFFKPSDEPGQSLGPAGDFYNWDQNDDKIIDMNDILFWNKYYNFIVMNETDVYEMFKSVRITEFDDGIITEEEFKTMNTQGIDDYVNLLLREHPRFRQRFSEQTWLPMEKVYGEELHKIRERVVKLTKLPRKLVYGGENMQVVKYGPDGHYHAHLDSETHTQTDVPCCHHTSYEFVLEYGKCKLCRFITLMMYLNDVEEGGETAFPAAHNETFDEAALRIRGDANAIDYTNLIDYCTYANLAITPKKGTAILWYNHLIDEKTGWLGELDEQSLHGGCAVKKGVKWIANIWLTAPYADSVDKPSTYFNKDDYENAERLYNKL